MRRVNMHLLKNRDISFDIGHKKEFIDLNEYERHILMKYSLAEIYLNNDYINLKFALEFFKCIMDEASVFDVDCITIITGYGSSGEGGIINQTVREILNSNLYKNQISHFTYKKGSFDLFMVNKNYDNFFYYGKQYWKDNHRIIIGVNDKTITEYEIPNDVTRIFLGIFNNLPSYFNIKFEKKSMMTYLQYKLFKDVKNLKNIEIPNSIVEIGEGTFEGTTNLSTVSFENNSKINIIGDSVFSSSGITTITIPSSVTRLGVYSFRYTKRLVSIKFDIGSKISEIPRGCFMDSSLQRIEIPNNVSIISSYAFENAQELDEVSFGENSKLIEINDFAFKNTPKLIKIDFPSGLAKIGYEAFLDTGIEEINLTENIKEIEGNPFSPVQRINVDANNKNFLVIDGVLYDKNITRLICYPTGKINREFVVPKTVQIIESYAFRKVVNLIHLSFENGSKLVDIKPDAFSNSQIETMIIPKNLIIIGDSAFSEMNSLFKLDFEVDSKIKEIGKNSFSGTKIREIIIPKTLEIIREGAFAGAKDLYKIDFEVDSKIKEIGKNSFSGTKIREIIIPKTLEIIREGAFAGAKNLYKIDFEDDSLIKVIEKNAFIGTQIQNFVVPSSLEKIGNSAFSGIDSLIRLIFIGESHLEEIDDFAFYRTKLRYLFIPKSVNKIGNSSFCVENKIYSIIFEKDSNLIEIGANAFTGTAIKNIVLPNSLHEIGISAFSKTRYLEEISLPFTGRSQNSIGFEAKIDYIFKEEAFVQIAHMIHTVNITNSDLINDGAFQNSQLTTIGSIVNIKYSNEIKSIGDYAFAGSLLESFVIPNGVETIGNGAFRSMKKLKSVIFEQGSKLLEIGSFAFNECHSLQSIIIPKSVVKIGTNAFDKTINIIYEKGSKLDINDKSIFSESPHFIF